MSPYDTIQNELEAAAAYTLVAYENGGDRELAQSAANDLNEALENFDRDQFLRDGECAHDQTLTRALELAELAISEEMDLRASAGMMSAAARLFTVLEYL